MEGTIVYARHDVNVTVDESPLLAVLHGGILIRVSKHDIVTLDASQSVNPDYPAIDDLQ